MHEGRFQDLEPVARRLLVDYDYPADQMVFLGTGAQSICFGSEEVALLINHPGTTDNATDDATDDVRPANFLPAAVAGRLGATGGSQNCADLTCRWIPTSPMR